jgi:TolA-binding protein
MNRGLKIGLYVGLLACLLFFGWRAMRSFRDARGPHAAIAATNQVSEVPGSAKASESSGGWAGYGALAFFALVGLAILAARDISQAVANRVEDFVFNDDLKGVKDPEYDEAERVWADGQPLEAIQLMRDFLKKNPSEQYAAIRIAEIYEKDLGNYLAAALEYEEILKKKLPPDRWGWAAIHLANLYSGKLNKAAEAETLLRRIVAEHPQTGAAKKARERLGEAEPLVAPSEPVVTTEETDPTKSNLPPGFRPK